MYDPSSPMLRPANSSEGIPAPGAKARFAEDRLLDAVIWCEIAPGEIVTEADMMDRFGLTRSAARSGLMRLGYDGWAEPQPRTGWLVLSITGALIGQILEARRIAEPALANVRLDQNIRAELKQILGIMTALSNRKEHGAIASFRHYADRVDGFLLEAVNPFTAKHLRRLWHHSARITHFLEDPNAGKMFHREDTFELIHALLTDDSAAIAAARNTLIDNQEKFFLSQLLLNDTPLSLGNRTQGVEKQKTTTNKRTEA